MKKLLPLVLLFVCCKHTHCGDTCIRSHKEWVHHPAWVQMIPSGKVTVPIVHPARDVYEEVCDEWASDRRPCP